jgi:SAM-dependent methyltransferase
MTAVSGTREFYERGYSLEGEEAARMGRWRAIGARSKVAHVETLVRRAGLAPSAVVEIGCGSGEVLAELARRGLAPLLDGFELSHRAVEIARQRNVARRVEAFDGRHVPAGTSEYDLAILTHVLEHVPDPLPLLKEAARLAPHVIVEVPLEDNRSAKRPAKRRLSEAAGHLHAFDRAAIERLIDGAGLSRRAELADPLPHEHHAYLAGPLKGSAKWAVRAGAHRILGRRAERLFTVHYAVLATRA